jgi:RNA polymerase sigma-70 factor (ECF subfamily)
MPAVTDPPLPQPDLLAAIPRLRRYARVLTGDVNRADDLVQETLARAWEKRRLWAAGSDLRAWLFTIMHNVFVNQRAMALREKMQVSLDGGEADAAWQIPVRATQYTRVELTELMQHVGRLPVEQREVLLLAAVEDPLRRNLAVLGIRSAPSCRGCRAREKPRNAFSDAPGGATKGRQMRNAR